MTIVVSDHAADRARERLGVPRRAVRRMAERAWQSGAPVRVSRHHGDCETAGRASGNGIFVFSVDDGRVTLLTVLYAAHAMPDESVAKIHAMYGVERASVKQMIRRRARRGKRGRMQAWHFGTT